MSTIMEALRAGDVSRAIAELSRVEATPQRRWPLTVDQHAIDTHKVIIARREAARRAAEHESVAAVFAAIADTAATRLSEDLRGIEWRESLSRVDVRCIAERNAGAPARYCGQAIERRVFGAKGKRGAPVKGAVADTRAERAGRCPPPGVTIGGDGEGWHALQRVRECRESLARASTDKARTAAEAALAGALAALDALTAVREHDRASACRDALAQRLAPQGGVRPSVPAGAVTRVKRRGKRGALPPVTRG